MTINRISSTSLALFIATMVVLGAPATAEGAGLGGWRIPSALVIAKSSNRNEVHYAVAVDPTCAPSGPQPVLPYWLMLERGPDITEPLSDREQRYLGISTQNVTPRGIELTLRAVPGRVLTIRTWSEPGGRCSSSVDMTIAGTPTRLVGVFAQQKLFGVAYVLLTGVTAEGATVRERIEM
jgi:Domain of unknown function (DUF4833)